MLRTFEGLQGKDPRTFGRDPRTQVMVRALGLKAILAVSLGVILAVAWVMGRPLSLVG